MHLVPVRRRPRGIWWNRELDASDAVVYYLRSVLIRRINGASATSVGAILHDPNGQLTKAECLASGCWDEMDGHLRHGVEVGWTFYFCG